MGRAGSHSTTTSRLPDLLKCRNSTTFSTTTPLLRTERGSRWMRPTSPTRVISPGNRSTQTQWHTCQDRWSTPIAILCRIQLVSCSLKWRTVRPFVRRPVLPRRWVTWTSSLRKSCRFLIETRFLILRMLMKTNLIWTQMRLSLTRTKATPKTTAVATPCLPSNSCKETTLTINKTRITRRTCLC